MKNIFTFLFFLFLVYVTPATAKRPIATVVKIHGNATQLPPRKKKASPIKMGDKLKEDTSILTSAKSFLRLRFIRDKSIITIGPKSKMVLTNIRPGKPSIITLLKGKIQSTITKSKKGKKNKFFVKTRSAALGVRGTQFETIYNTKNRVTSLITLDGEVAMAKTPYQTSTISAKSSSLQQIEKAVSSKEAVVVKKGRFASVISKAEKVTTPIKIDPKQLKALKNSIVVDDTKLKAIQETTMTPQEVAQQYAPDSATDTLSANTPGGLKSGGLVDLNTGLYIPPASDAQLDSKNKIYVAENSIGRVNPNTGQYIAPVGLALDAVKGFVIDKDNESPPAKKKLQEIKKNLNKQIAYAVEETKVTTLKKEIEKEKEEEEKKSVPWFEKHILTAKFSTINETLSLEGKGFSHPAFPKEYKTSGGKRLDLTWLGRRKSSWRFVAAITLKSIKYENNGPQNDYQNDGDTLMRLALGFKYQFSKNFTLKTILAMEENLFVESRYDSLSPSPIIEIRKVSSGRIIIGGEYNLYRYSSKFNILLDFGIELINDADTGDNENGNNSIDPNYSKDSNYGIKTEGGSALFVGLNSSYRIGENKELLFTIGGKNENNETQNFKTTRKDLYLGLGAVIKL